MSKPRRILMLAFPDCQMLDVTGPLQMFAGVNDELGRQAYELVIAAPRHGPFKTSSALASLRIWRLLTSAQQRAEPLTH